MLLRRTLIKSATGASLCGLTGVTAAVRSPAILTRQRELVVGVCSLDYDGESWIQATQVMRNIERATDQSIRFLAIPAKQSPKGLRDGTLDAHFGLVRDNAALHPAFSISGEIPATAASNFITSKQYLRGAGEAILGEASERSGIKVLILGHTGQNLGLWSKTPIGSIASVAHSKIAVSGLASKVVDRLGADSITGCIDPAGDITRDAIFAADGGAASQCLSSGLSRAARYCSKQAVFESASSFGLTISMATWLSLCATEKRIIQIVAQEHLDRVVTAFRTSQNAFAMAFRGVHGTEFYDLEPDAIMTIENARRSVLEDLATGDALSLRAARHFMAFDAPHNVT